MLGGAAAEVAKPTTGADGVSDADTPVDRGTPTTGGDQGPVAGDLVMLEVSRIARNPDQPRRRFDEAALEALASSLRERGLVQPVVVRAEGDGFVLIAGERRWRAAQRAGLTRIPALIREADEREQLEMALIENVVREDLNPIELAHAIAALVEDFGRTHEDVSRTLGRSRSAITNVLRLLELPDVVQEMVSEGRLGEGHARAVLAADGAAARRRMAERIVDERLSVRQAEALAKTESIPEMFRKKRRTEVEGGERVLETFYGAFEVPVRVRPSGEGAVVELRFPDAESLTRTLERLEAARAEAESDD